WGYDVTEAEFRKMQRSYRPEHFDMWRKKIAQLHVGMTEKQLIEALHPKQVAAQTTTATTYGDVIELDDAYAILALLDQQKRVMEVSPPVAITYHIVADRKKPAKT